LLSSKQLQSLLLTTFLYTLQPTAAYRGPRHPGTNSFPRPTTPQTGYSPAITRQNTTSNPYRQ
jgi:hypothetical protein